MAAVDFTVPYLSGEAERAFDRWLAAAASVAHWDNSVNRSKEADWQVESSRKQQEADRLWGRFFDAMFNMCLSTNRFIHRGLTWEKTRDGGFRVWEADHEA